MRPTSWAMKASLLITSALCLLTTACVGIGANIPLTEEPPIKKEHRFRSSLPQVWAALLWTLKELDYPIETADEETSEIATSYIEVGAGFLAENDLKLIGAQPLCYYCVYKKGRARLQIRVTQHGGSTSVFINAIIEGYNKNVTERWLRWPSLGKIEAGVFRLIRKRLGHEPSKTLWPSSLPPQN